MAEVPFNTLGTTAKVPDTAAPGVVHRERAAGTGGHRVGYGEHLRHGEDGTSGTS
jgi:hypothetical protein